MAVPTSITDLSVTAASNVPAGTDTVTTTTGPDEYFRAHAAIIKEACATVYTATGADTITFSTTPTFAAYAAGMRFHFIAAGANTGAVTLNVNSLGAKAVTKNGTTALASGDIPSGGVVEVVYDGTRFQLVGVAVNHAARADTATSATSATTATNIAGGAAGSLPYQTVAATTGMLAKGTDGQFLTLSAGLPAWATLNTLTAKTAVASTSGTSIDFTSIPSWVKRITVMLNGVSTNGSSLTQIRIGTGGTPATTGYLSTSSALSTTTGTNNYTSGFVMYIGASAATVRHGAITLSLVDAATNTWVASGVICQSDAAATCTVAGSVALAGALDIVRLTTVNGTDAFDAGSVNILYE